MKKKLFNVVCILLVCIFSIIAFVLLSNKANNKVAFIGKNAVIWVLTGSMNDVIPEQSYILIEKVDDVEKQLKVGDVITFYSSDPQIEGKLNTHCIRSIDYEKRTISTYGVNNPRDDDYVVPFEDVVGIYRKNLPTLTAAGRFLMTAPGFFTIMAIFAIIVLASFVPDVVKILKKEEDEKKDSDYDAEIKRRIAEEVEKLRLQEGQNTPENNDNGLNQN